MSSDQTVRALQHYVYWLELALDGIIDAYHRDTQKSLSDIVGSVNYVEYGIANSRYGITHRSLIDWIIGSTQLKGCGSDQRKAARIRAEKQQDEIDKVLALSKLSLRERQLLGL